MKKGWFFVLILSCLTVAVFLNATDSEERENKDSASSTKDEASSVSPSKEEKDEAKTVRTTATLAAIGDVLIHSSVYEDARTTEGFDFRPMFEPVRPYLRAPDITVANQESMIGGTSLGLSDYPRFNSPQAVGDALKDAGVDVVTMANNHTLDYGEPAIRNAITHWKKLGMTYTGAFASREDQTRLRTMTKNEITFAFTAYTYGLNGLPVPEGKDYLVNLIDEEKITNDIREARREADVVVVSVHFGTEYQQMPHEEQKTLVRKLAAAGADVILGHHPHVLQPPEWIRQDSGRKTFVVYSLGNFLAAQRGTRREIGGIMRLQVEKVRQGDHTSVTLNNPHFLPTWAYKKHWRNYKVIPFPDIEPGLMPQKAKWQKEIDGHMKQWMPDLEVETGME